MSTGKFILSTKKQKYAVVTSDSKTLLSRDDLRCIDRFVEKRVVSATYANGTQPPPSHGIPTLPFEKVSENCDRVLLLSVSAIHEHESALDVPLRFMAPEEYHAPALEEPPTRVPLARRIVALLQGADSAAVSWRHTPPAAKDNTVTEIQATKDAEALAHSSLRAGKKSKAAQLFCVSGCFAYNYGNMELAVRCFRKALDVAEELEDARCLAFCHNILGVCFYRLGEYKMSLVHHKKQEALGGSYARAVAEMNMGVSYAALGELEFAQQAFEDALLNARETDDSMLLTIALGNVGLVSLRIGDMRTAQMHLEQCLEQCSIAGDKSGASLCLLLLGEVYSLIHDHQHALFYYKHAYRVGGEANNPDVVSLARVSIGIAQGNAAIRDSVLREAALMGKTNSVQSIVSQLPQ
ncbi:putative Anaphase-promoting complex subunit 5/Tetratricopeptide repeat [Leishmania naiffi]|uniref:Anaphase-promoting complex subunit 5/Tetratricopeptide repeat n=1 Tax=Leishmania naiffi TaxID=5678 RepID=A0AAW3BB93_9TRYP